MSSFEIYSVKLAFQMWMAAALFVLMCGIIAANIYLSSQGRPFPNSVYYFAIGGAIVFGLITLLHAAVVLKRHVRLKAKASKDSGELDMEI